jgi:hypothetical protein
VDLDTVGFGLVIIGFLLAIIAGVWLLVVAYQVSVEWGLASTFIPFGAFVFLFKHWSKAQRPFYYQLAGLGMVAVGFVLGEIARA